MRHFFLRDRQGLYPGYPNKSSRKLIITESVIDAATLLEQDEIKSKFSVLALYGTNGWTKRAYSSCEPIKGLGGSCIFF